MSRKPIHIEASERLGKAYGRQAMWDAMRKKGTFTLQDIASASGRHANSVFEYMKRLLAAGIVEEAGYVQSPLRTQERYQRRMFRLVRDTGFEAPRLREDGSPLVESRDQM